MTIRPQNASQAQNPKTPKPKPQPQIDNPNLQRRICLWRIVWLPQFLAQKQVEGGFLEVKTKLHSSKQAGGGK